MQTHILGFPRIGAKRELKQALEQYWRGDISQPELLEAGAALKRAHWDMQRQAGLSVVATGDFSYYDHVLDISRMLGAVPARFGEPSANLDLAFRMARGDAARNIPAMEMTKWCNTNYHFIVPELSASQTLSLTARTYVEDAKLARDAGHTPKPVLTGPLTYLSLCKGVDGFNCWEKLDEVVNIYAQLLGELAPLCRWIQLDEPILCRDLPPQAREAFPEVYARLNQALDQALSQAPSQAESENAGRARLLLATYFDSLGDNVDLALGAGCGALHLDLTRGAASLDAVLAGLPEAMALSAGVVDGRNIWKTDFAAAQAALEPLYDRLGDRLWIGSSCSLMFSPVDLKQETALPTEIKGWMAFAVQKCQEIVTIAKALQGEAQQEELDANAAAMTTRRLSRRVHNAQVRDRVAAIDESMTRRQSPYAQRKAAQSWLKLPLFPTTTIGSFPQTADIRRTRLQFKKGEISQKAYEAFLKEEISRVVRVQEELGLDVLVHGESERNDMVEYFGQQLDGFCFTANGWVQSFGSRCTKPPVIFGDVSRPGPMTVQWITYAQSQTEKPMKGMLTGPVTILSWSFVRDDLDRPAVCRQLALAMRDEVQDLEAAGVGIIQIDEAAFSEARPLRAKDLDDYLAWAVECFRLTSSGVKDSTQIHSHMCYSEFNDIMHAIAAMDADVISIESSRSKMELLEAFRSFHYPNEIGPGVYDINSPRAPTAEEMTDLLERALRSIPKERLWVNPDCGLKTRAWPETKTSLANMVAAAKTMRERHG